MGIWSTKKFFFFLESWFLCNPLVSDDDDKNAVSAIWQNGYHFISLKGVELAGEIVSKRVEVISYISQILTIRSMVLYSIPLLEVAVGFKVSSLLRHTHKQQRLPVGKKKIVHRNAFTFFLFGGDFSFF